MYQHQTSQEFIAHPNTDKSITGIIQSLRDKEQLFRKEQLSSIKGEIPKSFPKLMAKQLMSKQLSPQLAAKLLGKIPSQTLEFKAKMTQKHYHKALQEEHKLISRQNMQLLGLTIQRVNISKKNQRRILPSTDTMDEFTTTAQESLVLNYQNCEDIAQDEGIRKNRMFFNKISRLSPQKRPQSIRVRGQAKQNPVEKRRKSVRPVNPQYINPIYDARITSYRELIYKLQWTYGFYMEMDQEQDFRSDQRYKAWIGGGNNSPLVKELIKRRFWWQIVEERNLDVNFVWTQLKVPQVFVKQTKAELWFLKEQKKQDEFIQKTQQVSKDLSVRKKSMKQRQRQREIMKNQQLLFKIMPQFEKAEYVLNNRPVYNKQIYQRQKLLKLREDHNESQKMHNHLTANFHLGNKKALFYNLKQYCELTGGNLFKLVPLTFHIKKGMKDPQYKRFVAYHKKRQAYIKKQEKQNEKGQAVSKPMRNIWIVKPGELTNRGNGITVIDQIYEFDSIIKSQKTHDNGLQKTFIVQLYIDRPFLYKRRKFDIRHYLMISQIHGVFKAYWFKQGYIRTSSYEFDVHNFEREIHLTNDAVQKYCPMYGKYEPANKISYADFQKYLDTNHQKEKYSFDDQILPRMKEIAADAIRSTYIKINPERLKHNFQVFGLDFMIDSEFNPWLIQVNTNPCLQLACPLLTRIIPQMLDQALRLTLDVIYPPPAHYPNTAKHLVPDASLEGLRWELLFDERVEGSNLKQIYRKSKSNVMADIGNVSDDEVYEDVASNLQINELL